MLFLPLPDRELLLLPGELSPPYLEFLLFPGQTPLFRPMLLRLHLGLTPLFRFALLLLFPQLLLLLPRTTFSACLLRCLLASLRISPFIRGLRRYVGGEKPANHGGE